MAGVDDFVFIYLFIEVKNKCRISGYLQDNSTHVQKNLEITYFLQ